MKAARLQQVLGLLLQQGYLQHKNSKALEELDNIVALLTYHAEELDVAKLVSGLTPALVESKSRVQHADTKCLLWWCLPWAQARTPFSSRLWMLWSLSTTGMLFHSCGAGQARQEDFGEARGPRVCKVHWVKYTVVLPSS